MESNAGPLIKLFYLIDLIKSLKALRSINNYTCRFPVISIAAGNRQINPPLPPANRKTGNAEKARIDPLYNLKIAKKHKKKITSNILDSYGV